MPEPVPENGVLSFEGDVLRRHLKVLCETYGRPMSADGIEGYLRALSDLTIPEITLAFGEAIKRCKYFPNPAEIREAMYVALERMPRQKQALESCPDCGGTGWKIVEKNGQRWAASCPCRKRAAS